MITYDLLANLFFFLLNDCELCRIPPWLPLYRKAAVLARASTLPAETRQLASSSSLASETISTVLWLFQGKSSKLARLVVLVGEDRVKFVSGIRDRKIGPFITLKYET